MNFMTGGFSVGGWAEVDLGAVKYNYDQIRQLLSAETKLLGVVKADAYGLGALEISRLLERLGIDMLGVLTVEEGTRLRRGGISSPILILGPFLPEEVSDILAYQLTPNIASFSSLIWLQEEALRQNKRVNIHLKVETGMGRLGFFPEECHQAAREVAAASNLCLEGVYTHLATAMWRNTSYANKQFQSFLQALTEVEKAGFTGFIRHIANSAAVLNLPHMHLDMVRVGNLLYDLKPAIKTKWAVDLKDPWSFKAKVAYLKELPTRHSSGYERAFVAKRPTRTALLRVGFIDGLQMEPVPKPRTFLNLVKGIAKLCLQYLGWKGLQVPVVFPQGRGRIIGKVGMQTTMVDVTGIHGVEVGSVASLPLRRTAASASLPRIYIEEGVVRCVRLNPEAHMDWDLRKGKDSV